MNVDEMAVVLRERYDAAKRNETALQIHLFGIEYAKEIRNGNYTIAELVEKAGMGRGYVAEISKAVKLSDYVKLK